jgi:hypothetical protein
MPLPPRGDPRRPLYLAVGSMWVLGVLLVAFSLCAIGSFVFLLRSMNSRGGGASMPAWAPFVGVLTYLVPGVLYIVFAIFAGRRRLWAVIGALVLASIQCLFTLFALVMMTLMAVTQTAMALFPLAIVLLIVIALAQLMFHLAKSFEALRYPPFGQEEHGFEPIGVRPATPSGTPPQAPLPGPPP